MGKFLTRKRLQIWIACCAILLNALAPSIAHALSAQAGRTNAMVICSVNGTKWLATGVSTGAASDGAFTDESAAGDVAPSDSPLHHLEHCPFCLTHAGNFALPASSLAPAAIRGGHDLFSALFYDAPAALFSWSSTRPRGPPAVFSLLS
ncbi:MAG: hypothetical protein ACI83P_001168 [Janthinobacterium sp.]|jgi:hypothetical protein